MRTGLPNGTSRPQENTLARETRFPVSAWGSEKPFFVSPCAGEAEVPFGRTRHRFYVNVWASEKPFFVSSCSGETEVPFGRTRSRFYVSAWASERRVVFGRGGWPNGMEVGFAMISALAGYH